MIFDRCLSVTISTPLLSSPLESHIFPRESFKEMIEMDSRQAIEYRKGTFFKREKRKESLENFLTSFLRD